MWLSVSVGGGCGVAVDDCDVSSASEEGLFASAGEIAFHDALGEFAAAGVEGDAACEASELVDEADPVHAPVIFDESEACESDVFASADGGFFECGDGAAIVGRIDEVDEVSFDMCGGLAVGDDEDLFIFAGACAEDSSRHLQSEMEVGEVLGRLIDLIDRALQADFVIEDGDGLGHDEGEGDFGYAFGAGVEADEVDGVIGKALSHHGQEGEGDLLGGQIAVIAHHGSGEIDEDDGADAGGSFALMDFEVAFVEVDSAELVG